jgi:hypothetical protein
MGCCLRGLVNYHAESVDHAYGNLFLGFEHFRAR